MTMKIEDVTEYKNNSLVGLCVGLAGVLARVCIKHPRTHARTHAHTDARTHARTHARSHTFSTARPMLKDRNANRNTDRGNKTCEFTTSIYSRLVTVCTVTIFLRCPLNFAVVFQINPDRFPRTVDVYGTGAK